MWLTLSTWQLRFFIFWYIFWYFALSNPWLFHLFQGSWDKKVNFLQLSLFHFTVKRCLFRNKSERGGHNGKQQSDLIESYQVKPWATLKVNGSIKTRYCKRAKQWQLCKHSNSPQHHGVSLHPHNKILEGKNVCLRIACSAVIVHVVHTKNNE